MRRTNIKVKISHTLIVGFPESVWPLLETVLSTWGGWNSNTSTKTVFEGEGQKGAQYVMSCVKKS